MERGHAFTDKISKTKKALSQGIKMEVRAGFEPAHSGFADHGVSLFATAPRHIYYNMPYDWQQGLISEVLLLSVIFLPFFMFYISGECLRMVIGLF